MQHLCPRCRQAIQTQDDGVLSFCVHCGAPQVRLSEDLLRATQPLPDDAAGVTPAIPPRVDPAGVNWRGAIQCAALAGGAALVLAVLSAWNGNFALLEVFWAIAAPIVALGIYAMRFPGTRIQPRFGARLGLLTGGAVALAGLTVSFIGGLLDRFVFHNTAARDAGTAAVFAEAQQRGLSWAGPQPADATAQVAHMLSLPEFRAGMMLIMLAVPIVMYLVFSATGGAFAGFLRSRKPAAS